MGSRNGVPMWGQLDDKPTPYPWRVFQERSQAVESALARVGRPLTPVSVAGVARRRTRQAVVGEAVVGGAVVVASACVRVLVNGAYVCRENRRDTPIFIGAGIATRFDSQETADHR